METLGIDTKGQTTAGAAKPKSGGASKVFGDLLGKLFDRLAASPVRGPAERELDASLFQAQSRTLGRDLDVERPDTADDHDAPTRARGEVEESDENGRDAVVAAPVQPQHRTETGDAPADAGDETAHCAAAASAADPAAPAIAAAPLNAAAPLDAAARQAAIPTSAPAANLAPQVAPPLAAQGGDATQPQAQITVTVTAAPAQAQPTQPLAANAALALQSVGDQTFEDAVVAPSPTAATNVASAGNVPGASDGLGAHTNQGHSNQGQSSANPFAGIVPAANAAVAAQIAAETPKPFAAQLDADGAISGPAEGAHRIFAAGQANAARAAPAASQNPQSPRLLALDQIAINVQKALDAGKDKIMIQLKPIELGRIDVTMETGDDGKVAVQVRADRPETLELLQRDARGLERALQDAGLRADSGALSFGLRGENRPDGQGGGNGRFAGAGENIDRHADDTAAPTPAATAARADGRVDLYV